MAAKRSNTLTVAAACLSFTLASAACGTVAGPSRPDKNWNVHETTHFSLYVRPGSVAEQHWNEIGQSLDDQYDHTLKELNVVFAARIAGFLYTSGQDANLPSEWSGVGYPDTLTFKATCTSPFDAPNELGLVGHESNHVVIIGALGRAGTSMMSEGLATTVLSERYHHGGRHRYYPWTRSHASSVLPIADLLNESKWNDLSASPATHDLTYTASASFLGYLLDTYGPDRLKQIYGATSGEFAGRFAQVYGKSLAEAEADWLRYVATWVG